MSECVRFAKPSRSPSPAKPDYASRHTACVVCARRRAGRASELESVSRVSLFRPARTVTGPSGEYWELYVSKTALPAWKEGDAGDSGGSETYFDLLELPFAIVSAIWSGILVPI